MAFAKRRATLLLLGALCLAPGPAEAQEGSDRARVAGGALGLYSGAVLATLGGVVPCTQTYAGAGCVRVAGALGGAVGLAGGVHLGGIDEDAVADAARGAGWGLLVGSAAGFALKESVPRFGWSEVLAGGMIGSAFGASAKGATIGLAAGSLVGLILYWTVPSFDLPNSIGVALAGMALGGISYWVVRGVEIEEGDATVQPVSLSISVSF